MLKRVRFPVQRALIIVGRIPVYEAGSRFPHSLLAAGKTPPCSVRHGPTAPVRIARPAATECRVRVSPARAGPVGWQCPEEVQASLHENIQSEKRQQAFSCGRADRRVAADQLVIVETALCEPDRAPYRNLYPSPPGKARPQNDRIKEITLQTDSVGYRPVIAGAGQWRYEVDGTPGPPFQKTPARDFDNHLDQRFAVYRRPILFRGASARFHHECTIAALHGWRASLITPPSDRMTAAGKPINLTEAAPTSTGKGQQVYDSR